jgi:hypothetical protein
LLQKLAPQHKLTCAAIHPTANWFINSKPAAAAAEQAKKSDYAEIKMDRCLLDLLPSIPNTFLPTVDEEDKEEDEEGRRRQQRERNFLLPSTTHSLCHAPLCSVLCLWLERVNLLIVTSFMARIFKAPSLFYCLFTYNSFKWKLFLAAQEWLMANNFYRGGFRGEKREREQRKKVYNRFIHTACELCHFSTHIFK